MIFNADQFTVGQLQEEQPWTVPYSDAFEQAGLHTPHNMSAHAVLHGLKSLGKLAAVFEAIDHRGGDPLDSEIQVIRDMSADLFTIALRLANLHHFSLATELLRRILEKNGVRLWPRP
jgi:hypothetical protein